MRRLAAAVGRQWPVALTLAIALIAASLVQHGGHLWQSCTCGGLAGVLSVKVMAQARTIRQLRARKAALEDLVAGWRAEP